MCACVCVCVYFFSKGTCQEPHNPKVHSRLWQVVSSTCDRIYWGRKFFPLILKTEGKIVFQTTSDSSALFYCSPVYSKLIFYCLKYLLRSSFPSRMPDPSNSVIVKANRKVIINSVATLSCLELQTLFLSGEEHSFLKHCSFPCCLSSLCLLGQKLSSLGVKAKELSM